MQGKLLLRLVVLIALISVTAAALCGTDDGGELATDCYRLFKTFESSLIEGEGNLYRMGKAFFYSPHADPVLFKVVYNITYGNNVTLGQDNLNCSGDDGSSYLYLNNTNATTLTYGWTSNGILTVFHPSLLNWMQMQLPLSVLRTVHTLLSIEVGPQAESFLWDGSYNLPTLHINLHLESLPCLPSDQVYDAVLQDITALLKVYAAEQGVIPNFKNVEYIGYTLESSSTSATTIIHGYVYAFYVYFFIGFLLSFLSVFAIMTNLKSILEKLSRITIDQINVWKTICHVAVITMLMELILEFVWSVIWSTHTDPVSALFIWNVYLFLKLIPLAFLFILSLVLWCKFGFSGMLLMVVLMLAVMAYYLALPTFLFLLVYPINVVAVFAYMAAFMFTLIVSIIAAWNGSGLVHTKHTCHKCSLVLNIFISLIYLFVVLVIILYIIAIGKTSVITFSFYGVLSLLPSVAITAVSWMFKNKLFKKNDEDNEPGGEDNEDNVPGRGDDEPGTNSELQPLINTQRIDVSGTDVRQRTNYQTTGEQPPQDP